MLARRVLLVSLLLLASGCSDGGTAREKDLTASGDALPDSARADILADLESPDTRPVPDTTHPDDTLPDALPPLTAELVLAGEPQSTAHASLELRSSDGGEIVVEVVAHGLGKVAGLAFGLQWPAANLELLAVQSLAQLGSSGAIETRSVSRVIQPGRLSFGAARFCLAKMPWGKVDQCGGVELNEDSPVARLTFRVITPGLLPLVFDSSASLVRRPDRSPVSVHWLNATLRVGR